MLMEEAPCFKPFPFIEGLLHSDDVANIAKTETEFSESKGPFLNFCPSVCFKIQPILLQLGPIKRLTGKFCGNNASVLTVSHFQLTYF